MGYHHSETLLQLGIYFSPRLRLVQKTRPLVAIKPPRDLVTKLLFYKGIYWFGVYLNLNTTLLGGYFVFPKLFRFTTWSLIPRK